MEKIKIIQFIISFGVGGAENIAKQYCKLIDDNKFDLLVIAIGNKHSYHDIELKDSGINVIYLNDIINEKFMLLPSFCKRVLRCILRPFLLRNIIHSYKPDIIHYHLPCSKLILQANPLKDTKIFLTVHSEPSYFWGENSQWKSDYKSTIKLARRYDYTFIALHDEMKKAIDNKWFKTVKHNTIIMNNGIDLEKFKNLPPREDILGELGISKKTLVIGHVGSLIDVKNHDFLIDVFYELKKKCADAVLVLAGDGVNRNQIEQKVRRLHLDDFVIFLGIRNDIPKIMKCFDVLVFPSFTEGISLTLIEAQVSGVRCVVSDSVPRHNEISNNLVKFMSLNSSPQIWAENILNFNNSKLEYTCDTTLWDMHEIVHSLEKKYIDACK